MDDAEKVLAIIREFDVKGKPRGSNIYSDDYRQDIDNDSSTDEEDAMDEHSSDEEDVTVKSGKIATQTSRRGKVRIKNYLEQTDGVEEDQDSLDEFEADMEKELASRLLEAERNAAIAVTKETQWEEPESEQSMEAVNSKSDKNAVVNGKYSDVYFDSDEEDSDNRNVKSNDDLFYDPDKDDDDQDWVDSVRKSYQVGPLTTAASQKIPSSDAVLNCPACFTVLCLDCQRHELYKTQYRAMFVVNCTVDASQKLKFPVKKGKKGKGKLVTDPNCDYHPVTCDSCKTEVAMYDQDEVYHFFNVVASHS